MITITRYVTTDWKEALKKYLSRASTRPVAYQRVAEEYGYSEGYIKKTASEMGLVSLKHSVRFTFSEEEEQALVCACIIYSRQGTPLTIDSFIQLASFFANKDEKHPFSRHFCYSFLERHSAEICLKSGKLTSPTRCSKVMREKTLEFIARFEKKMAKYDISLNNIVVFDETVIGDAAFLPKVITERRKSGGGNGNVVISRMRALGSYLPFSMPDGSTPFRVFIINEKTCRDLMIPENPILPTAEKGLRETPYRLFLSSETGYISTELFIIIMDAFTYWWTTVHEDVHCLLISDNLAIHKNKAIVKKAKSHGIHMINIMPGSSHWFQVHDQIPFAELKKKMMLDFYKCFSDRSTDPAATLELRMADFYEAEKNALGKKQLQDSFKLVGLYPYDPKLILDNCRKQSPVPAQSDETGIIEELAQKICMYNEKRKAEIDRLRSTVKYEDDSVKKKATRRKRSAEGTSPNPTAEDDGGPNSSSEKSMEPAADLPTKRAKIMHMDRKTCASKGCQKSHL